MQEQRQGMPKLGATRLLVDSLVSMFMALPHRHIIKRLTIAAMAIWVA
jgi:hypothetical protein